MPEPSFRTTLLEGWIQRIKAGDRTAKDELIRSVGARLELLARKMLNDYPRVRRFEETDDVLQSALIRLCRALEAVEPASTREFFGLAAEQIRRELVDLARHYYGKRGIGANQTELDPDDWRAQPEPAAAADPSVDLERWSDFHQEISRLPTAEREVVELVFYHGWTQEEVANLFSVDVRTIRRRWQHALLKLHESLGEDNSAAMD
jgi:RNA polymerase sigma-70 factor (ECF subfamily)